MRAKQNALPQNLTISVQEIWDLQTIYIGCIMLVERRIL